MNNESSLPLRISVLDELKSKIDGHRIGGVIVLAYLDEICLPSNWPKWFDLCRNAQQRGGDSWLSLVDLLAPFNDVFGPLYICQLKGRYTHMSDEWWAWLHAGLRLAQLGRYQADVAAVGITPGELDGVEKIAIALRLPEPGLRDLYAEYRGIPRLPVRECTIGLPLYEPSKYTQHEGTGVMGELRLALMPEGHGVIYRAFSLAFTHIEEDFRQAVEAAWHSLSYHHITVPADRDIRWEVRLRKDGSIPKRLSGNSCGGSFAMGLMALLMGTGSES